MIHDVEQALDRITAASMDLAKATADAFPIGTKVFWASTKGNYKQLGEIIDIAGSRVQVRNERTLVVSWMTVERLTARRSGGVR
jgi:hypothetical protein